MLPEWASAALNVPAYLLLIVTFILNVVIMVPVAQFCGHVMLRANTLAGYGCNLLGSIAGVGLLFVLSWLWQRVDTFYAIFDEFMNDETRALYNFSQAFPVRIEFLAHDDPVNPQRAVCRISKAHVAASIEAADPGEPPKVRVGT